jgi:hypothetical protein
VQAVDKTGVFLTPSFSKRVGVIYIYWFFLWFKKVLPEKPSKLPL